ncbi:ABC transporter ATP-binding protein [Streptomyces flavofungini]|uniref:ABC transporter ATP-binding protein n=1 Tax=Streptomyces flavofungini TaxID=68200 RepID=UPI001E404493|nr:ATP-binding cassette domain-containing protein [Streptomyces flavofungini]
MVAPPDNDVLWARALHVTLNGSPALTGVSLGVREGEILAVGGPRGSGKTTLLRCLSGQLLAAQGEVWFNSAPVHTLGPLARERLRRDKFGWIDPEPRLVPELNAWENAALGLMLRGGARRGARTAAHEWLERLDIGDCARKRPHALTQAERQRVSVARALACAPSVLFADEPTAPLHRADRAHVLRTLTTAARSHGITVVLATHDAEVAALADRAVTLLDGRRVHTVHLPGDEVRRGGGPGGAKGVRGSGTPTGPASTTGTSSPTRPTGPNNPTSTTSSVSPTGPATPTDSDTEGRAACSLSA